MPEGTSAGAARSARALAYYAAHFALYLGLMMSMISPVAGKTAARCIHRPPKWPENAWITDTQYTCSGISMYKACMAKCFPRYVGNPSVICLGTVMVGNKEVDRWNNNGEWSDPCRSATCTGTPPPVMLTGYRATFNNCNGTGLDQTCAGRCEGPYPAQSLAWVYCRWNDTSESAYWTPAAGYCLKELPPGPAISNCPKGPSNSNYQWESVCDNAMDGFICYGSCLGPVLSQNPAGPPRAVCKQNGTWEIINPCVAANISGIACANKPNATIAYFGIWPDSCNNVTQGFVCNGTCVGTGLNENAAGPPYTTCRADGTWDNINNQCVEPGSGRHLLVSDNAQGQQSHQAAVDLGGSLIMLSRDKPLEVAPITIVSVQDWPGHTAADLASCLAGSLVTVEQVQPVKVAQITTKTMSAASSDSGTAVSESAAAAGTRSTTTAASSSAARAKPAGKRVESLPVTFKPEHTHVADKVHRMLTSGGLFLSPMPGGRSPRVQDLRQGLKQHYDSLAQVPRCLVMPYALQLSMHRDAHWTLDSSTVVDVGVTARVKKVVHSQPSNNKNDAKNHYTCDGIEGASFTAKFLFTMAEVSAAQKDAPDSSMWLFVAGLLNGKGCY